MSILVTGGAGFIGSCLIHYLNKMGREDIIVCDDINTKEKNLEGKQFIDIISKEDIFTYLKDKDIETIFHLGACSDTLEHSLSYLMENNYLFSIKLLKYGLEKGSRFIYASSAATYGMGEKGFSDSLLEELVPINMYAFSKYLFDVWIMRNNYLDKVVGLKYFNVFGPNEYHKNHMASMVFKMMKKAENNEPIYLFKSNDEQFEDGEQERDFIYVKDAVAMTLLFFDKLKDSMGIFNIGSGRATSWNEVATALFKALGKESNIKYIDMPKKLSKQYQNYTRADMDKLNSLYEHKCMDIEDSVEDYTLNYLLRDLNL